MGSNSDNNYIYLCRRDKSRGSNSLVAFWLLELYLDPTLTKGDSLTGQIAGAPGTLPETRHQFVMELHLLERVVGVTREEKINEIKDQ